MRFSFDHIRVLSGTASVIPLVTCRMFPRTIEPFSKLRRILADVRSSVQHPNEQFPRMIMSLLLSLYEQKMTQRLDFWNKMIDQPNESLRAPRWAGHVESSSHVEPGRRSSFLIHSECPQTNNDGAGACLVFRSKTIPRFIIAYWGCPFLILDRTSACKSNTTFCIFGTFNSFLLPIFSRKLFHKSRTKEKQTKSLAFLRLCRV